MLKDTMDFDVIVVGGGLVGASLALALRDSGLKLALVEARPPAPLPDDGSWDSRVYAISPANAAFLARLGVWDGLDPARIAPVHAMRIWGDDGQARLDFNAYEIGASELAFIAESRLLQDGMWRQLERQENMQILSSACTGLEWQEDAAVLSLADGRACRATLVVGADGRDSWVREQAGIATAPRSYHQKGVVANFNTALPHGNIARQWFRPDGILAYLPLPGDGGNRVSIVWSTWDEQADELVALPPRELCERVAEAGHQALGGLELITPAAGFSLRLLNIGSLVRPRLALVGDAAHNVHPLAGQGVNLGFADAQELAKVLTARGAQRDCGDYALLRRYDRARQEDILAMQLVTEGLQKLFNNTNPLLRLARNAGLSATQKLSPLKNLLARHALGAN